MPRNVDRNPPQHWNDHCRNNLDTDPEQDTRIPLNQSVSDSLTGDTANIPTPASYLNLNTSAAIASVLECITLQQSTYHIPQFDSKNPPLKEFLQDVANGAVFVTDVTEPGFINAVLAKLKGVARESVRDKQFSGVKDLIAYLKKRFAPTKKYQWYFESIVNLRMKKSETVSDYNDRVQGLLSGARHAIEEEYAGTYGHTKESAIIMKPVIDCALDACFRGLPDDISIFVDIRNPKDLSEAFEHALHAKVRQTYTEEARNAVSSYHIARPREFSSERQGSPSRFSKQMEHSEKQVKSERPSSMGSITLTMTGPSTPTNQAPMYTSMYSQYHLPYPPYQPNYQSQYPYSFP